jgi:hypothetical protein
MAHPGNIHKIKNIPILSIYANRLYTVVAKDGTRRFSLKNIEDLPDWDGEIEEGLPVFVTFTLHWAPWTPDADSQAPTDSPSKKKSEGYKTAVYFNLQDVIVLNEKSTSEGGYQLRYKKKHDSDEEDIFM